MTLTVAGIAISDPVAIWRDYSRRTKTLDRYDLAPAGDPGLLRDDDIWRTWIVASRISADERTRLVIRAATAPWHNVPADSELAAADPAERDGLFDKAAALYYHFAVPAPAWHRAGKDPQGTPPQASRPVPSPGQESGTPLQGTS